MSTNDRPDASILNISMAGLTLQVADVECSLAFYAQLPGAQVAAHRPGAFALLYIGKGQLGLLQQNIGPMHIEFDAPDPDALYQHLKQAGFPVEEPPTQKAWGEFGAEYDFTFHDPDGYSLEFNRPHHS